MRKLASSLTEKMIHMPETGMGYQIVTATYRDHSRRDAIVLNCSLIEPIIGDAQQLIKALLNEDLQSFEKRASYAEDILDVNLRNLPMMFKAVQFDETLSAQNASISHSRQDELFIRFSAFLNDRRITSDGGLLSGTFATTDQDAQFCVKKRIDPRARYALPNPNPVRYAFQIEPPAMTSLKRGIVQPANNQPGGGVEVIFINGSPAHSVTQTYTL